MSAKNIEAFIPWYPDISEPDFTYQVSRKKEFNDLYLEKSEPFPEKGELLQSQMFMKRFFGMETPYAEALLAHGLGTGKACVGSAIVENYKNSEVGGRPRKPALVIVKSEDLARNIANEVANVCTREIYTPKPTVAEIKKGVELTEEAKVARLNRAIAKSYEIVTMETFLKNLPSDEEIKRRYNDRPIIIDEAHALRIQPPRKKKKRGLDLMAELVEDEIDEEFEREMEEAEPGSKKVPKKKEESATVLYDQAHRFLHLVNGRKLLLTGTPIWDKPSEIASVMNLILGSDEQLETGSAFDAKYFNADGTLNDGTVGELRQRFRGRVSFLRQMMTTAKRIETGAKEPWLKHVAVFPDGMSETQAAVAREAREAIESKTIKIKGRMVEREVKGGTVLKLARDAMNMVIPTFDAKGEVTGVEYGPDAFKKYVIKNIDKRGTKGQVTKVKTYQIDTRSYLAREIRNNLREYSAKFASIIEDIKAHPNEVTFIYNEEVTGPGGAIMLGLCLELYGLGWAKTASDITRPSKDTRRFAVITSDPQTTSQSKQVQELIASSNNDGKFAGLPSNAYAERLQVIIGSEKIALGLSIKNVRRVHVVMPHWNIPSISQAEARGYRFGSHEALKPEERIIRIFRHMAVETPEGDEEGYAAGQGFPSDKSFTEYETTDVYIYRIAEEKEYKNSQIYRILKEEAFDCAAFYRRNVLDTDVAYTRDCDYQECNYECDGFPPVSKKGKVWNYNIPADALDYSSYNLFYSAGRLKEIIEGVVALFGSYFSLLIEAAQALLEISDDEKELLLQAVDIIINSRTLIRNRYGFGSYLKESGNMLFLDSTVSPSASYPESTYIENPLISEITPLDSLVEILELEQDRENVLKFCKAPSKTNLDAIAYKTKIILLEASYASRASAAKESAKRQKVTRAVLDEMGDYVYKMSDGTPVHILYSEEFKGPAYAVAVKDIRTTGMMRRFAEDVGEWSYVGPDQEEIYIAEIRAKLSGQREVGFGDNPYGVFGWVSKKDGSFRINIKPEPGKKGKVRGRKCENFQVPDLIDIFVERLGYFPESRDAYLDMDKTELVRRIKGKPGFSKIKEAIDAEAYNEDQLRGILTLMTYHIEELCELLMTWFEQHDLLFSM